MAPSSSKRDGITVNAGNLNLCLSPMEIPWYVSLEPGGSVVKGFVILPCMQQPGHQDDHSHRFVWTNRGANVK